MRKGKGRPVRLGAVLAHLAGAGEDDEANLSIAEHREVVGLLQKASSALGKGDLPSRLVLDPLDGYLSTSHTYASINDL
ncbi:hypothetical protein V6N13_114793 [Hibiscus sabdariffa]